MEMRPKSTARDLPPRLLRRKKTLVSGEVWQSFYYNGRDEKNKRIEIPLGNDLNEAKRKWAKLEGKPKPAEAGLMKVAFDRYECEVITTKALSTQRDNRQSLAQLRKVFDTAPFDQVVPQHIARYRDSRKSHVKGSEGKPATVRANREISLFSHIWNMAREWGYTAKENPCRGVRKHKETPRDFYADAPVWSAVYNNGASELQDAMDLIYLSGQRPADVLKMMVTDVRDGALKVQQGKTNKILSIMLDDARGVRSELGIVIDRIRARPRKVHSLYLVATPAGIRLSKSMLRDRFDAARNAAIKALGDDPAKTELAARIRQFQFRDGRSKAASEIEDLQEGSDLLGHSIKEFTKKVYVRVGQKVKPTR